MNALYYRYLGYRQNLAADMTTLRANGIYTLFTETKPQILHGEIITGNIACLRCDVDKLTLTHAEKIAESCGYRKFITNRDHYAPLYTEILELGVSGLIEKIEASMENHKEEPNKVTTLKAMRHTLCGFRKMIANYAEAAKTCKEDPSYEQKHLDFIIENCTALVNGKPQTFAQALQLIWFCHLVFVMEDRDAMALGRMDQYLYPFYKADIEDGRITDEEVVELLENVFIRLDGIINICIGGQDVHGNCQITDYRHCSFIRNEWIN